MVVHTDLNVQLTKTEKEKVETHITNYINDSQLQKRFIKNIDLFLEIQKKLIDAGLPEDFAYIIIVESGFNPRCQYEKAYGLWQLTKNASEVHGITKMHDFFSPEKSTDGAISYLLFLKNKYNNNHRLMIYAYNFGSTKLDKLLKKHGNVIPKKYIPTITKQYLPKILAAKYIFSQILYSEI